ncbi:MAG: DUF4373 domain-containing protein [Ignavibacteriales bacterium]|nr:DUF4373 domain-containing protein [Ignavibacteriales bacterium]
MKWFHHDCAARHDPKLRMLAAKHGLEGWAIFWALLEEIGEDSDTFHLKIMEFSKKSDKSFANLLEDPRKESENLFDSSVDLPKIPRLPAKTLAKNLFTTSKTLTAVIRTCVSIGIFDQQKWLSFNVLYSPSFEQRADDYTRRIQRRHALSAAEGAQSVRTNSEQSSNSVRTLSEQNLESLRTKSGKVHLETEAEQIQKENRNRRNMFVKDANEENLISTSCQQGLVTNYSHLIELSQDAFFEYSAKVHSELSDWNDGRSNKFDWNPTEPELRKLFLGGDQTHKETLCYSAYNLLGEKTHYAELVLRAVHLMLKASAKTRITNPFGWMWTCLHGNGDGTHPWVQLLTADEENSVASLLRRRVRDNHPP